MTRPAEWVRDPIEVRKSSDARTVLISGGTGFIGGHLLGRHPPEATDTAAAIYYNGECPICRTEMEHYADLCAISRPDLRFVDSTKQSNEFASCGLRREHAGHHCARARALKS